METNFRRNTAIVLISVLALFLGYALLSYINGIFGALILYVIFNPLYKKLNRKIKNKTVSALSIILFTVLLIIIPMFLLTSVLVGEVQDIAKEAQELVFEVQSLELIDNYVQNVDIQDYLRSQISNIGTFIKSSLLQAINKVTGFIINLIIAYFLLFYMFLNSDKLMEVAYEFIPFKKKNSKLLIQEFKNVTNAVVVSTGAIAVLQGVLLGVGLYIFGVPGAALWGAIGIILSFLPVVGVPLIWLPAGGYKLFIGEPWAALGVFIWGLVLSNIDNFIRPALQKKVGRMHPLISLVGVFIGLPFFGIMGLIIGPLLLSYFFLALKMFKEEHTR